MRNQLDCLIPAEDPSSVGEVTAKDMMLGLCAVLQCISCIRSKTEDPSLASEKPDLAVVLKVSCSAGRLA